MSALVTPTDLLNIFEKKLLDTDFKINELNTLRKESMLQCAHVESEIEGLEKELLILDKVSNLFKHLLDTLLEEKKKDIEQLVTYGLKTVFEDQDLKFHINLESKYNGIATSFKTEQVGVAQGDVLENFGGGIANVESFLLRIITLFQTNMSPYLFLDESFSMVSESYVENCSVLINNICKQLGLTVFLITHQELMLTRADKVYRAASNDNSLTLEELTNGTAA